MRKWMLLLLTLLFAPAAHAGPVGHTMNSFLTLAGAYAGCAGGGLLGMGVYGAIDPYGSDDGLEWVLIGAPAGCAIGAPIGGALFNGLTGGERPMRVLGVSGLVGLGGAALVVATPALYQDFEDERFALAYVGGFALAVLGTELAAFFTALASKGHTIPVVQLAPMIDRERRGLVLAARF